MMLPSHISVHSGQRAALLTMGSRTFHAVEFLPRFPVVAEGINRASVFELGSGYQGRTPLNEAAVFIVGRESLRLLSAPVLEDAQPRTWTLGGHEPQGSPFLKANPHVPSLSKDTLPSFSFQG